MQLSAKHHEYWNRNITTTAVLLVIWFVVTYVIGYYARSLDFNFFAGRSTSGSAHRAHWSCMCC